MITVGYMSIDHFDNEVRECLVTIVGNKPTKFKSIDSFDNLYKAMESKSIDIILLSRKEKNDWENILDVSGRFKILNLNGYYYIGFPKGNNAIIDKFNNCINQ
jgi:ABC-type amino acid transport substrate-binding protein